MNYDRDEVKRLERELEINGDNRFRPYRIGEKTPESKPDLLSLADQLADAARQAHYILTSTYEIGREHELYAKVTNVLAEALITWDAARKGR